MTKLSAIPVTFVLALTAGMGCTAILGVTDIQPPLDETLDATGGGDATGRKPGDTTDATEPADTAEPVDASIADTGVRDAAIDWMACLADGDYQNACALCQDQSCCGEYLACKDDTSCQSYETCVKACITEGNSSGQCTLQCSAENEDGHAIYAPSLACVTYHCYAPCSGGQTDPCGSCLQASCDSQDYACESDPSCDILRACNETCADQGDNIQNCMAVCAANAPAASQQLFNAYISCETTYCAAACQ